MSAEGAVEAVANGLMIAVVLLLVAKAICFP